jgi:hypothetical protein
MEPLPIEYPVTLTFDPPAEVARWRPLVAWLLVIPHLIVLSIVSWVAGVVAVIAWFITLITGALPPGLAGVLSMVVRYQARVALYASFLKEEYPPFTFETTPADPGDDARVHLVVEPQLEDRNRLTVFFRAILVFPHMLMLGFLGIGVMFVMVYAFFAVLFTQRWPEGARSFVVGYFRWNSRAMGYYYLLTDEWPPIALD